MKKFLPILIIVFFILVWSFRTSIISVYLSKKLQLPISIERLSFSKGKISFVNFRIKNLKKQKEKYAFTSKNIDILYSWDNLKKSPSLIDAINMKDNFLNIECNNPICTSNNWTDLLEKVKKKDSKEIIIKKISVQNLSINIYGMGLIPGAKKEMNIPYLSYNNISSKEGFPIEELIISIFRSSNLMDFIKEILNKSNALEKFFKKMDILGEGS